MASVVAPASATIFESLPARPPTPPREAQHDSEASSKAASRRVAAFDVSRSLQTPPNASSAGSAAGTRSNPGSSRLRKKVEWSAHTDYKEATEYRENGKPAKSSPPSAPSSAQSKPVKGILKPSSSPIPSSNFLGGVIDGNGTQTNIIEMLDSTIKQLAGTDRHSKLDAYMMLARALKASNNLPDRVALQDKMSLFMQFIQRDVLAKGENSALDSSLINHALSLLATFLQFHAIASTLTTDFGVFIMDHAIRSFEDAAVPKDVVRHLMQVVAFQTFSSKVMTSDRVGRLVATLHRIETHLKGKSIIMSRIHIYKKLIKQCRTHMIAHADWLKDLFTDLLSNIKEIRAQAISLGSEAGFSLRSEKQLMLKAGEILQSTNEDETYIEFYIKKLQELIKDRQTASAVPQIWGVIILFLRCPLDRWQHYGPWLTLVQSAFNMADVSTKQEANFAWSRYIYLSLNDSKISPKALGTLCQPLLSQLKRKVNSKQSPESTKLRNVVIGGICNLFYYTFAPGNDKYPASMVWEVAVQPIINLLVSLDGKPDMPTDNFTQATKLLQGLLDVSVPKVWRQDHILTTTLPMSAELPAIDPKWIRRHSDKVLAIVAPMLETHIGSLADNKSDISRLWQALVGSIAAASAKDIKVSDETAKFLADSYGVLSKLWSKGIPDDADIGSGTRFLSGIGNFISTLVQKLGVLPFSEKKLSATQSHTFEPVATPSQGAERSEKAQGVVRLPLHHLFVLLSSLPPGITDNDELSEFFQSVFQPFFKDRPAKARTDLSKELFQLLPRNTLCPYGPWLLTAQNMCLPQDRPAGTPASNQSASNYLLGPHYRDIVSLLERGLTDHPNLPMKHWSGLFNVLSAHAIEQVGHAGQNLTMIEPLAKSAMDQFFADSSHGTLYSVSTAFKALSTLLRVAHPARDAQAVDAARHRLWGTPIATSRHSHLEQFENLNKLCNRALAVMYERFAEFKELSEAQDLVTAYAIFLENSFHLTQLKAIVSLRQGICTLIKDEKGYIPANDSIGICKAVQNLWDQVCNELVTSGRLSRNDFDQIEPLFVAAFQSKNTYIVNKAAEAWNSIAKDEESFDCSDSLKSVVSSLQSRLDLAMPGGSNADFGAQAVSFSGAGNPSFIALSSASSHNTGLQDSTPKPVASSKPPSRSSSRKRGRGADTVANSTKATSTPRKLRHENSQLRFAHVASSSPVEEESQHLTERQREVRERQRRGAAMYSDITGSSPSKSQSVQGIDDDDDDDVLPGQKDIPGQSTPQRGGSFNDLISSTPTPRRGHLLHMDDYNDPPSSPPLPRPDPLQSEIQSRSRGSSAIEQWQFSSPPGTPVKKQQPTNNRRRSKSQKTAEKTEKGLVVPSETAAPQQRRSTRSRRHTVGGEVEHEHAVVIPSSFEAANEPVSTAADDEVVERSEPVANTKKRAREQPPSTPLKQPETAVIESISKVKQLHDGKRTRSNSTIKPESTTEKALALPVEVAAANDASEKRSSRKRKTTESVTAVSDVIASSLAQHLSSPCPPVIPSTPVERGDAEEIADSKRKRKHPGRPSSRSRKRRSVGGRLAANPDTATDEADVGEEIPARVPFGDDDEEEAEEHVIVPSPGHEIDNSQESELVVLEPVEIKQERRRSRRSGKSDVEMQDPKDKDGGDTDEEIFSQLATESRAASQNRLVPAFEDDEMEDVKTPEELTPRSNIPKRVEATAEHPPSLLDTLEKGLAQLRGASLSRDEVYRMEDMLMDMKRELFEAERRGRNSESIPR